MPTVRKGDAAAADGPPSHSTAGVCRTASWRTLNFVNPMRPIISLIAASNSFFEAPEFAEPQALFFYCWKNYT